MKQPRKHAKFSTEPHFAKIIVLVAFTMPIKLTFFYRTFSNKKFVLKQDKCIGDKVVKKKVDNFSL